MCRELICLSLVGILGLAHTASADLVGWWKFDDGAGSIAVDSSGNGYDGTVVDASWEAGQLGAALAFGGGAYVDVPAEAWSTIETQATVTFWAYGNPDAQPQANFIFGAFTDPANNNARIMSAHVPWSDGTVYFDTSGREDAWDVDRINLAADPADYEGTWTHWAFVKNVETGDQQIYMNGVLWHSGTGMTKPLAGAAVTKFTIGCKPSIENFYVGMIDDFRLYDQALTEQELQPIVEGADTEYPFAIGLEPANGVMIDSARPTLRWKPGDLATSHVIYLGEMFEDVNEGSVEPIPVTGSSLQVGVAPPYAGGLTPGQTYYWRVDGVSDTHPDSPWRGNVRSFRVRPAIAWDPSPMNAINYVVTDQDLTWEIGLDALFHTVYFGESFDEINEATAGGWMAADPVYDPGPLEPDKTYYWRVDEFVLTGTVRGEVWSFRTVPVVARTDEPNLVGWWTFDEGIGATAVDWSGYGNHGVIEGDGQWVDGYHGGALDMAGTTSVDIPAESWSTIDTQATLMLWAYGDPAGVPNNFIFGAFQNPTVGQSRVFSAHVPWGGRVYFDTGGTSSEPYDRIDQAARPDEYQGKWHHWAFVKNAETGAQEIYLDGELWHSGTGMTQVMTGVTAFTLGNQPIGGNPYRGMMDDVRLYDKALTAEGIQQAIRGNPLLAWSPNPDRGAILDIREATSLNWLAGDTAASHDVYLGTDREAVASAGKDAAEYQGNRAVASLSLAGLVEFGGGDYYWRIDEIEADGTVHTGGLWKFTIPAYLIVEDFESYDDDMEAGTAIFQTWIDGWENSTGSTVGHLQAIAGTFGETTVVYDGGQSMPLDYNNVNSPYYAETSRTFSPALNLTVSGMDTLTLYVAGQTGNDPAQLYVGLKSGATRVNVAYGDDTLVQSTDWVQVNIPFADFAGVNAAAVNEMFMTLGDPDAPAPGGAGLVFIDAIRTTKAEPAGE